MQLKTRMVSVCQSFTFTLQCLVLVTENSGSWYSCNTLKDHLQSNELYLFTAPITLSCLYTIVTCYNTLPYDESCILLHVIQLSSCTKVNCQVLLALLAVMMLTQCI
jgi:hypothetical protein